MVRNRILYLLALAGATVFYGFFYVWFSEFLLILLLALPWVSLLASLPAMLTFRVTLEGPNRLERGTPGTLQLKTLCPFPQPKCRIKVTVSNGLTGLEYRLRLRPKRLHLELTLPTEHCGRLVCRVRRVRVCDYLGLFALPRREKPQAEILVLPGEMRPEQMPGLGQLRLLSFRPKPGGGFAEHHELRDYRPGDSLRQVHWKLTAKTGRPIVREPQIPHRGPVVLSLDLTGRPETIDQMLAQAVYLSRWLLEHESPHQVCWMSGTDPVTVAVSAQEDLDTLARALCCSTPTAPGVTAGKLAPNAYWHYHIPNPEEGTSTFPSRSQVSP